MLLVKWIEPPYTEPYVRWCERSGKFIKFSLLLDCGWHVFPSRIKRMDCLENCSSLLRHLREMSCYIVVNDTRQSQLVVLDILFQKLNGNVV